MLILHRKRRDAHTKLSCRVPISGWLANLLTSCRGDRIDLPERIENNMSLGLGSRMMYTNQDQEQWKGYTCKRSTFQFVTSLGVQHYTLVLFRSNDVNKKKLPKSNVVITKSMPYENIHSSRDRKIPKLWENLNKCDIMNITWVIWLTKNKWQFYEYGHLSETECVMTNVILIWVLAPTIVSKKCKMILNKINRTLDEWHH